jgi:tRNA(fMet)-specific endonuclease VapC
MYLLDTNHCSQIIFGNSILVKRASQIGESLIYTNTIVAGELIFMAENSEQHQANLDQVMLFLDDIGLYIIDDYTSQIYGRLKSQLIKHFRPKEKAKRRKFTINQLGISDNDLWIAANAIQHKLTVVSTDSDFLKIKQVENILLENWIN